MRSREASAEDARVLALTAAISCEDVSTVEHLLHSMANSGSPSDPSIVLAARLKQWDAISLLIQHGASVNSQNERGESALMWSTLHGASNTVHELLQNGANPNLLDFNNLPALSWAVTKSNIGIITALLNNGANVNCILQGNTTALHKAVSLKNLDVLKLLVSRGANINRQDEFGDTPLFESARQGTIEALHTLLENGAEVNIANTDSRTALHIASASVYSSQEMVEHLLEYGARLNAEDRYGCTPLTLTLRNHLWQQQLGVPRCLMRHGAVVNSEMCVGALKWMLYNGDQFSLLLTAVDVGLDFSKITWLKDFLQNHKKRQFWFTLKDAKKQKEENYIKVIQERMGTPRQLIDICRLVVRSRLVSVSNGKSVYLTVPYLPLPELMKTHLLMDDLDEL